MRKAIAVLLSLLIFTALLPTTFYSASAETSGQCGETTYWSYNSETCVLTISGTGEMDDYEAYNDMPWYPFVKDIKKILVEEGVTKTGHMAFYGCESLTEVMIPTSVRILGGFINCKNLESIDIPYGVEIIQTGAFTLSGIKSLLLPGSVSTIETGAFSNSALESIVMPNRMTKIEERAFQDCYNLTKVIIPEGIITLEDSVFLGCSQLEQVILPSTLTKIYAQAFWGCERLRVIMIPESVDLIGAHAFYDCKTLSWISLPESMLSIEEGAFRDCSALSDVFYAGTQELKNQLEISTINNDYLINADWHYNRTSPEGAATPFKVYSNLAELDNRYHQFGYDESIENVVMSEESTRYNPKTAHFLAVMARGAYNKDLTENNYIKLGLENRRFYHYDGEGDLIAAYTIGEKILEDETRLILITIRGTSNINQWLETNFNLFAVSNALDHGWHSGFYASAKDAFESLKTYMGGNVSSEQTKYVITGHSLGGAVGNLLSMELFLAGVDSSDVYNYNFACPNVAIGHNYSDAWNQDGMQSNIHNVCNWCDIVPSMPDRFIEKLCLEERSDNWTHWDKYGIIYWFNTGFQFWHQAHDMAVYVDWLANEYDTSHFTDVSHKVKVVSGRGPYDIIILDLLDNPAAGIINNEKYSFNGIGDEKVLILVNGDKKLFYLADDADWNVRINATGEGLMEYGIAEIDLNSSISDNEQLLESVKQYSGQKTEIDIHSVNSDNEKLFESVKLYSGKKFICNLDLGLDVSDVKLYVVNEDGRPIAEVHNDGTETPIMLLGDVDGDCTVTAEDAAMILRYVVRLITLEDMQLLAADANDDGKVTAADAALILRALVGLEKLE